MSVDQFSKLCTMAIKNAHIQRRENDLNWMLELVSTTSNRIGYRMYPQTMILSEADTYKLLDLALLHTSEENKRRTTMMIQVDHEGLCRIYMDYHCSVKKIVYKSKVFTPPPLPTALSFRPFDR